MERRETNYLRSIFLSGLGFGIGGVIGNLVLYLLVRSQILGWPLNFVPEGQQLAHLLSILVLIILGIGLSTGLGGAIGGFALSMVDPIYPRRKYLWRSAISAGLTEGILVIPLILLTSLLALYNNGLDREPTGQIIVFGIYGIIFGIIFGLILGLSTVVWRQVWRVILASITGFGLGGAAIGYVIRIAYYPASLGKPLPNFSYLLPILTFILFGIGGLFLGWVYEWITHWRMDNVPDEPARWVKVAGVLVGLLIAFFVVSNYRQLVKFLTIRPGSVSTQIPIDTAGVHWREDQVFTRDLLSSGGETFSVSASPSGDAAAVWVEEGAARSVVFLSDRTEQGNGEYLWSEPIQISVSPDFDSFHPQVVKDHQNRNHVVWVEQNAESSNIFYRSCDGKNCGQEVVLSSQYGPSCEGLFADDAVSSYDWPAVSIAGDHSIMAIWSNPENILFYATWDYAQTSSSPQVACLKAPEISGNTINQFQPRLSGRPDGSYSAVFSIIETGEETVYEMEYYGENWSTPQSLGSGKTPEVFSDPNGLTYYAWCDSDGKVRIKDGNTELVDIIDFPACMSRPSMSLAENSALHLVWYSDEVRNNLNVVAKTHVIYESIQTDSGWSDPAIVVTMDEISFPVIAGLGNGDLSILWSENSGRQLRSALQPVYQCSPDGLGDIGQKMLNVIESGGYRPEGESVPYCNNIYLGLIYMPNPNPAYSPQPLQQNGGFAVLSELADVVEYEVDLSVMEWAPDEDNQGLNPGSVYIREIAKLYQQIRNNPARYPRGLTVRILLGNYPELTKLEWGEQIWNVIADLRNAGVDKMVDPDIGWKVELANYEGVYPHSHTKFMVIDGKISVGAGFNFGYLHYPYDHPSNKGGDLFDLGMILTGPIAQQVLATFDDYWQGAEQLYCPELTPDPGLLWTRDCVRSKAQATHVPEVQKYYLPVEQGDLSHAFSLNRNIKFKESDDVLLTVLSSAQESIDIWEVNFSLELICTLDLVNDEVCSYDDALDYMKAIMTSVEQNQAKVRVLVEKINSNGMENRIAAKEFTRELKDRGLDKYVEIRFFEGRMHSKAFLIDNEMLFVGSQNFHYSAWGEGGLAEYNVATDDPRAITTFKSLFDYYWETGIPWEEYK